MARRWPHWWTWEIDLSPHLLRRMEDRRFTEIELRRMLDVASGLEPDTIEGRWAIQTRFRQRPWRVVVEPEESTRLLVIVTAYPTD